MGQKTPIKLASSALNQMLDDEYMAWLSVGKFPGPSNIPDKDWKNDVTKWPLVDMGKIFTFIHKHKEFDSKYIGKFKLKRHIPILTVNL